MGSLSTKSYRAIATSPEKRRKSGQITLIHRTSPEKHLLSGETIQSHSASLTFRGIMSDRDTFDFRLTIRIGMPRLARMRIHMRVRRDR